MAKPLTADTRKPYGGPVRSLVIAIDVGTTFSGVSYAILEPGEIPKIHGVTRFPGQEHVAGNTKIPSILYYDKHGNVKYAGAEADNASVVAQAEEEGWIKVELFKLRLRPRTMQLHMNGMRFSPLPKKKTAVHVFGDFLAYMFNCTKKFIVETHAKGGALWDAVGHTVQFVLSHPNGWEGPQQSKMRRAAIHGGLIPDTNEGKARIWFVTEGEASLHSCVLSGLANEVISSPSQHGFLIADAGGGTLDISSYAIRGTNPLVIEEVAPPDCIFAGSVFVSRMARQFLEEKLKNSKYGTPDSLDHITRKFDETTKRLFRDIRDLSFIHFGSPLDKDPSVGVRNGQLKLTGVEVANLFEPSVDAAVKAIKQQIDASKGIIRSVFLVGGYAASPWLFSQLKERLATYRVTVNRPDSQTSKAVADGAVGFFCDHHVSARMSKFMYGVEYLRDFDPANPGHVSRRERLCELPSGPKLLPDAFDCILARSVMVKESTVFSRKYSTELTSLSLLSVFEVEVWCYRGGNEIPLWIDRHSDTFSTLCIVQADLSVLSGSAAPKVGKNGKHYWTIVFAVEIHFGLTEFKARIKWVDGGNTKYGPATIIYNEHGHRSLDEEEPDTYPEDDHAGGGTPRSERQRSLPGSRAASRARTPEYPSSPAYDGNSLYTGEGSIRGIPPPSVSSREPLTRERTTSKPVTSRASPAIAPPIERDFSAESMKTSVSTSKGKSSRDSRASGATGRIGETLSATWGAGDPQFRSPIQSQGSQPPSPYTSQPPAPYAPQPQAHHIPQPPAPDAPQPQAPHIPQAPVLQQTPSQSHTQSATPKSSKSRKGKTSAVTTVQPSPQPSFQPPPEANVQSHHASPRSVQAAAQALSAGAVASPRPQVLPLSRSVSHVTSPTQKHDQPLSPLNPAMHPHDFEFGNVDPTPAALEATGFPAGFVPTEQNDVAEFGAQDSAWEYGEGDGFYASTGEGTGDWTHTLDNSNNPALGDGSGPEVPGSFEGVGGNGNLLDKTSHAPLDNPTNGGATVLSGSISSLLGSNPVGELGDRLSSTFGFASGKQAAQSALGSGFNFNTSLGSFFSKNAGDGPPESAVELDNISGATKGVSAWGQNAGSKVSTPKSAVSSKAQEHKPAWGAVSPTAGSASGTPNLATSPKAPSQASVWGSTAGTNAVTPAPLASPQVSEQTSAKGKAGRKSKSGATSKNQTPNPPASPQTQEQASIEAQLVSAAPSKVPTPNLLSSSFDDGADAYADQALGTEEQDANRYEEYAADQATDFNQGWFGDSELVEQTTNENQEGQEAGAGQVIQTTDETQEEQEPGAGLVQTTDQTQEQEGEELAAPDEPTTPAVADDEDDWGVPVRKKNKNKKGGKQEPAPAPAQTPAEDDTSGFQVKKKKKGKR